MAIQSLVPITPIVTITPGVRDAWVTTTLPIPSIATGAILQVRDSNFVVNEEIGVRKPGSTDNRRNYLYHSWIMMGVSNRRIQLYLGSRPTNLQIYLVGYTLPGVTFFTNGINYTPGVFNAWVATDLSPHLPPNAIGAVFEVTCTAINQPFGIRMRGSTDNRHRNIREHSCFSPIIGCDGSQWVDIYCTNQIRCYLVGYVTSGITFYANALPASLVNTGVYNDLPALPAGTAMGIIEVNDLSVAGANLFALRAKGDAEDIYDRGIMHTWAVVKCDENGIIEGKISDLGVDFWLNGPAHRGDILTSTNDATTIKASKATLNGELDDNGGVDCDCGFEWGETPALGNRTPTATKTTGESFFQFLTGLGNGGKDFYFRAFATNLLSTGYGSIRKFTTIPIGVTTLAATNITEHSARINGVIAHDDDEVQARFEWGGTNEYGMVTSWEGGLLAGDEFHIDLGNLAEGHMYHFRTMAMGSGVTYGGDGIFVTLAPLEPVTLIPEELLYLLEAT